MLSPHHYVRWLEVCPVPYMTCDELTKQTSFIYLFIFNKGFLLAHPPKPADLQNSQLTQNYRGLFGYFSDQNSPCLACQFRWNAKDAHTLCKRFSQNMSKKKKILNEESSAQKVMLVCDRVLHKRAKNHVLHYASFSVPSRLLLQLCHTIFISYNGLNSISCPNPATLRWIKSKWLLWNFSLVGSSKGRNIKVHAISSRSFFLWNNLCFHFYYALLCVALTHTNRMKFLGSLWLKYGKMWKSFQGIIPPDRKEMRNPSVLLPNTTCALCMV